TENLRHPNAFWRWKRGPQPRIHRQNGQMPKTSSPKDLADKVRGALDSGDLDAMSALLHPNAKWGAPDDDKPSCQNRSQVLGWYQQARDSGMRARVTEVAVGGDKILVGLKVAGRSAEDDVDGEADRWQVMTVVDGK